MALPYSNNSISFRSGKDSNTYSRLTLNSIIMCYQILKATRVCVLNHVLERRSCWRQCKQILSGPDGPYTRCEKHNPDKNATLQIDDLINSPKVDSFNCVFCMSDEGVDYRAKKASADRAEHELFNWTVTANCTREYVTTIAQTPFAIEENRSAEESERQAKELFEAKKQEARLAADQVDLLIQDTPAMMNLLYNDTPIFYYGPLTGPERRRKAHACRKEGQLFDAGGFPEHIVDWSEPSNGSKSIVWFKPPVQWYKTPVETS